MAAPSNLEKVNGARGSKETYLDVRGKKTCACTHDMRKVNVKSTSAKTSWECRQGRLRPLTATYDVTQQQRDSHPYRSNERRVIL